MLPYHVGRYNKAFWSQNVYYFIIQSGYCEIDVARYYINKSSECLWNVWEFKELEALWSVVSQIENIGCYYFYVIFDRKTRFYKTKRVGGINLSARIFGVVNKINSQIRASFQWNTLPG